jgi:hypothetical protein
MASDIYAEYCRRCKAAEARIIAKHPRMALPLFAAALHSRVIGECGPWLMAQKRKMLESKS